MTTRHIVAEIPSAEISRRRHARILTMKPASAKLATSPIVWSIVWAFAIIATAFLCKGNPAGEWIETALVGGALAFVVLKSPRPLGLR
jgi:hypothetical protein